VNGQLVKKDTVRIDGIADLLNIDVPSGDLEYEARIINRDGSTAMSAKRHIHVLGSPAIITMTTEDSALQANGVSSTKGIISVYDEWKYPLDNIIVTLQADSGKIMTQDLDPTVMGTQLKVVNGKAEFMYRAGRSSGLDRLTAHVDKASCELAIHLNTPHEKFTLVGLATGSAMSADAGGPISGLANSTDFPDGTATSGRLAMYARGTVFDDYLFTGSFDSDRKNVDQLFRQINPDYLYSIYGDNSMLSYDAQTNRQLFLKLEHNMDFIYWGDYSTADIMNHEFTMYNRSFNGLKFGLQNAGWKVGGFGTLTDRKVSQVEIRGNGLSGYYDLGHTYITPGSEKVRIETRDRYHSEVVLTTQYVYRYTDYEIDNDEGTLYFKLPVPAIDQSGNPVYIIASFESSGDGDNALIGGARVEKAIGGLTIGANGVIEQQQPVNYTLLGTDAKYVLGKQLTLSGELARSNDQTGDGYAYKVETAISPLSEVSINGYYRKVDSAFVNETEDGSGNQLGTEKYGADLSVKPLDGTRLFGGYYRSTQSTVSADADIKSLSGGFDQSIGSMLTATAKVEDIRYDGLGPDTAQGDLATHSTLGTGALSFTPTKTLSIAVTHDQNFGNDQNETKPNATSLVGTYKLTDHVSLQTGEKFYSGGGALSMFGVSTQPTDGSTLYGTYEIGNAIGEYRNMASIGFKDRIKLPWDLFANVGYEKTQSLETDLAETAVADHTAYSGSLEYLPEHSPLKLTSKAEYGENSQDKIHNYNLGGSYRFMSDLSLLGKYSYNQDANEALSSLFETRQDLNAGLAYRPVNFNWFNMLAKYEYKVDNNHYLDPFDDYNASIISAHAFLEPIHRLELGAKYAYRVSEETQPDFYAPSHTTFYLLNARYDIIDRWDIGGEYRVLLQKEANDLLNGYSAEVGYVVVTDLRLGAGYNFKGFKDRDLVDYSNWSKGPFIRLSFKFDEGLLNMFSGSSSVKSDDNSTSVSTTGN
jgi:hypothetical protein